MNHLKSIGLSLTEHRKIETPRMGFGENSKLRVPYESIITFKKGDLIA